MIGKWHIVCDMDITDSIEFRMLWNMGAGQLTQKPTHPQKMVNSPKFLDNSSKFFGQLTQILSQLWLEIDFLSMFDILYNVFDLCCPIMVAIDIEWITYARGSI